MKIITLYVSIMAILLEHCPRNGDAFGLFEYYTTIRANDRRIEYFQKEWFEGKDVLDVGCNIGVLSLKIAKEFKPRRLVGIDRMKKLIERANENLQAYMSEGICQSDKKSCNRFTTDIEFRTENYVLPSDNDLEAVIPEFDAILTLSITQFIHLHNGDDGLKRFFKRAFNQLRPGGIYVLEPQPFSRYTTKETQDHQDQIKKLRFRPDEFKDFLIEELGYELVFFKEAPEKKGNGLLRRQILVFKKPE